jgi:hypothetical protein
MTHAFYAANAADMTDCVCCDCLFELDPVDPETQTCAMCIAGESPGMERLPNDLELARVTYELDCGIAGVEPYTVAT